MSRRRGSCCVSGCERDIASRKYCASHLGQHHALLSPRGTAASTAPTTSSDEATSEPVSIRGRSLEDLMTPTVTVEAVRSYMAENPDHKDKALPVLGMALELERLRGRAHDLQCLNDAMVKLFSTDIIRDANDIVVEAVLELFQARHHTIHESETLNEGGTKSSGSVSDVARLVWNNKTHVEIDETNGILGMMLGDKHVIEVSLNKDNVTIASSAHVHGDVVSLPLDIVQALRSLSEISSTLCVRIRRMNEMKEAQRRTAGLLELRREAAAARSSHGTPEHALQRFLNVTKHILRAEYMVALLVDPQQQSLVMLATASSPKSLVMPIEESGPLERVLETDSGISLTEETEPAIRVLDQITGAPTRSLLAEPVRDRGGQVVAIVIALNRRCLIRSSFASSDADLLVSCCSEIEEFLRSHVSESLLRRKTQSDADASSLVEAYLGRSVQALIEAQSSFNDDEDDFKPALSMRDLQKRTSSTDAVSMPPRAVSLSPVLIELHSFEFDVFRHGDHVLCQIASEMVHDLCENAISIESQRKLSHLFVAIRSGYKQSNPFHNWKHAFAVMHMTFLIVKNEERVFKTLGNKRRLALLISAIAHDIAHPGNTNQFEINSGSELALRFNDQSVLENHHCFELFKLLRKPNLNVFSDMPNAVCQNMRHAIVDAILATDMSRHFECCKELEAIADMDELLSHPQRLHATRDLLTKAILHCADLSGQGSSLRLAVSWEERISTEFRQQAEREKAMGLPVAPFMEGLDDPQHRGHLQVQFIDYVLQPLWKEAARLFPCTDHIYKAMMGQNRNYFVALRDKGLAEANRYMARLGHRNSAFALDPTTVFEIPVNIQEPPELQHDEDKQLDTSHNI